ncbi:hypothetical protein GF395_04295 [Candidatus Uhrbacteria bacterium]|nr:hypothetical protein [Candidatus Uhrbacteria bacterium]
MMTTDEAGVVDQRLSYTAFGETVLSDGQGGEDVGGPLPAGVGRYGYAGGWGYETGGFDPAAGLLVLQGPNTDLPPVVLQHVGARWYDAGVGRFVQRDPIGVEGGLNVYVYCGNDPLGFIDPSGLTSWDGLLDAGVRDGARRAGLDPDVEVRRLHIGQGIAAGTAVVVYAGLWGGYTLWSSAYAVETAEIVCVTAEAARKRGAQGGVKLTIHAVERGASKIVDVIFGPGGGLKHGPHVKGPYGMPRLPEWLQ